jgi:glyoxylase-like metal-dependent hydrolase (beta-lactamase superfamily II)
MIPYKNNMITRTFGIRLGAAVVAMAGLWVAFTQQQPQPLTIAKVKGDLYNIVGSGGNVGVYVTDEGVILIDDKFTQNYDEIVAKVKSVTDRPIRYVLNTHHHGDHTGSNAKFLPTAEVIAHKNARINIVEKKQPGAPRISFSDEQQVDLGGKTVIMKWFGRGHTNGDAVVYFPELKVVHMGDLFVTSGPFIDDTSNGSGAEWTKTIDAMMAWDFDTVIPGHGDISTRADLVKWNQNFGIMKQRVAAMYREGKSREDAAKSLKVDDLGFQAAGPMYNRTILALYAEMGKK